MIKFIKGNNNKEYIYSLPLGFKAEYSYQSEVLFITISETHIAYNDFKEIMMSDEMNTIIIEGLSHCDYVEVKAYGGRVAKGFGGDKLHRFELIASDFKIIGRK